MNQLTPESVEELFSLEHFFLDESEGIPWAYKLRANVYEAGGTIHANGSIVYLKDHSQIGTFSRRLYHRGDSLVAYHETFEIRDESHHRHGIAFAHYQKALRGYLDYGCKRIEMYAVAYGTFVWPQFDFRYAYERDRVAVLQRTRELYAAHAGESLPQELVLPSELALIRVHGYEVGAEAMQQVARERGGGLEMYLDLTNPATLSYLSEFGILSSERA